MPEAAALPAAGSPPPVSAPEHSVNLRDFPDRLSPMLVKELRQGLRSPLFLWAFLGMHLLLTLITLTTLEMEGRRDSPGLMFWWSIVLATVIIMPLRGFNALIDEVRLNTMDTLVLTRLTAWRIAFGKWCAIAAQEALVAITILPYLILRYFAGGVDLGAEVLWLVLFLTLGWVFTAFTIGFSWMKYFLLRGIVTLGVAAGVVAFCTFSISEIIIDPGGEYQRDIAPYLTEWLLGFFITSAYLIYFMLDSAAAQVAPLAENRSTLRRVITLGLAFSVGLLTLAGYEILAAIILSGITCLAGLDALTEHPKHISVISHPFVRHGFAGKFAGKFLYPGWHSGVYFFLLLTALTLWPLLNQLQERSAMGYSGHYYYNQDRVLYGFWLSVSVPVAGLLCAFLIMRFLFRRSSLPLATLLGIMAVLGLLHGLIALLASAIASPALNLLLFFSPISLIVYWGQSSNRYDAGLGFLAFACCAQAIVYALLSCWLAAREFRKTRACELQAERDLSSDPPPPAAPQEFQPLA